MGKDFVEKCRIFVNFCKRGMSDMLKNKLTTNFPNVYIAFRINLAIFGTSCESERSFLVLKSLKHFLRSTISKGRLSGLLLHFYQ